MKTCTLARICTAALLAALCTPAVQAQEPASSQEIVVEAPREFTPPPAEPPVERSAYTGAPVITATVKVTALYGDLDLTRADQAQRLMTRIDRLAHDACRYLDRLLPLSSDPACVAKAVALATPAAKSAIAAAQK